MEKEYAATSYVAAYLIKKWGKLPSPDRVPRVVQMKFVILKKRRIRFALRSQHQRVHIGKLETFVLRALLGDERIGCNNIVFQMPTRRTGLYRDIHDARLWKRGMDRSDENFEIRVYRRRRCADIYIVVAGVEHDSVRFVLNHQPLNIQGGVG